MPALSVPQAVWAAVGARRARRPDGGGAATLPDGEHLTISRELDRRAAGRTVVVEGGGQEADMVGRARVVVVDDDKDLREIVVQVLKDAGLDAVGYGDARVALAALRGAGETPAAILLDLEMPGMTGWEFRSELLRDPLLAHVPVVVASGVESPDVKADAYLPKPFGVDELCDTLARVGGRAAA